MKFEKGSKKIFIQVLTLLFIFSLLAPVKQSFASADITPPILNKLTIAKNKASLGESLDMFAELTDDASGVEGMTVYYKTPDGKLDAHFFVENTVWKVYQGRFFVDKYSLEGVYKIDHITIYDKKFNYYSIYNSEVRGNEGEKGKDYEYKNLSQYDVDVKDDDKAAPSTSVQLSSSQPKQGEWYKNNVVISLKAVDEQSQVEQINYRLNGGEWKKYFNYLEISNEGSNTIEYRSIDNTGNVEKTKSISFKLDKTAPKTSVTLKASKPKVGNWYTSDVTLTFNAADTYSKIKEITYRVNGGKWLQAKGSVLVNTEGLNTIEYKSTDNAGNVEAPKIIKFSIDKNAPVTTSSLKSLKPKENDWYKGDVTVSLSKVDNFSRVKETLYRVNGGKWTPYTKSFYVKNEGINTVEYKSTDNVGNTEKVKSVKIKIDKSNPTLTFNLQQTKSASKSQQWVPVKVTVYTKDKYSGVNSFELVSIVPVPEKGSKKTDIKDASYGKADTDFSLKTEVNKTRSYKITYKVKDKAGNYITAYKTIAVKYTLPKK